MVPTTIVSALLTLGMLPPAVAAPQDPLPAPGGRLEWIGPKVHKTAAVEGELVRHTLRFMNGGEGDLLVESIEPTCQCVTASIVHDRGDGVLEPFQGHHRLGPGEVMELALALDTTGKQGTFHARIEIRHSGSDEPSYGRLIAELVEPFTFTPTSFAVGSLLPDDERTGVLELTNAFGQSFVPLLLTNRWAEHIDVELEPIEPDADGRARRWRIELRVRGTLPFRANGAYPLIFGAELPGRPEFANAQRDGTCAFQFRTHVEAEAKDWISFSPRDLSFGRLWAGRTYEQTVAIYDNDDDFELALTADDVTIEGPDGAAFHWRDHVTLDVNSTPGQSSAHVTIKAQGFPKFMRKPFVGRLVVATGHPRVGTLHIPFAGRIR